jgi:hypothetical protein
MKLINEETGERYNAKGSEHLYSHYTLHPIGKYERAEMFGIPNALSPEKNNDWDTHTAICFLEKIEKVEPMPAVELGYLYLFYNVENRLGLFSTC